MSSLFKHCVFRLFILLPLMLPLSAVNASELLRAQVEILGTSEVGSNPHGLHNIAELVELYAGRNYQPLWFGGGPLAPVRDTLVAEIADSAGHGFPLGRYHYQQLLEAVLNEATLDLLYTDALMSQAEDRFSGVIQKLEEDWFIERPQLDTAEFLATIFAEPDSLGPELQGLWPQHSQYWALVEKRAALAAQPDVFTQRVPPGPVLRLGDGSERVRQLQLRLYGPGAYSGVFDEQLRAAVKDFQHDAGLEPDGLVGPATLELLNADRFSWIDQIDANLERWRWLPRQIPSTYIRVNIADFNLLVVQDGERVLTMDVIVGQPYRSTPVFTESLRYLVFFPYWNLPYRIAVKDKLPLLRQDPVPLAAAGYEVQLVGSNEYLPVTEVDWEKIRPGEFTLRQKPGPKNALGRVKFMLPNPHAVYLHDTPDKRLFNKRERVFSSGCIRLAEPAELARWVLEYDASEYLTQLDKLLAQGPTTTAYLSQPIPVFLVYFTAFEQDGVVFRRDVYGRDRRIIEELRRTS